MILLVSARWPAAAWVGPPKDGSDFTEWAYSVPIVERDSRSPRPGSPSCVRRNSLEAAARRQDEQSGGSGSSEDEEDAFLGDPEEDEDL